MAQYPFEFDPFQAKALEALERGDSVLVAAPTGAGKTVVGEFAVWLALMQEGKAFYTTPLKALSNQKFGDFIAIHGAQNVGLLTGDNSINPGAPVVVMTTEVLRNMIYERSELLADLRYVVLDEVHYLQDPYRGAVWEEVIIHLPLDVKIVSLSATVSNAEEFADWIETIRGSTTAVIEDERPVELKHHYLTEGRLLPMFTADDGEVVPNPQIIRMERREPERGRTRGRQGGSRRARGRRVARRTEVIELLAGEDMLPAIYFIFSRKGCDAAVEQCLQEGLRLTTAVERSRIQEYAEMRCSYLNSEDLEVLGYGRWMEALAAGIASHHAGFLPVFKETVEELFRAGLVKAVFATETLSLGINVPARTVVIESLIKFTGERHEMMTPGEFTQLTGRAGRRGIDILGHAVVLQQEEVPFLQSAGLASTRIYPLISSFQPSYNMATNLVRNYSREEAEHLLNCSFAQYRADKDVVVLERQIERDEAYLASYHEKMVCDRGDFAEYWWLVDRVRRLERSMTGGEPARRRQQTQTALSAARPGQVFIVEGRRVRGPVVVVGSERSRKGELRVLAITHNRRLVRLTPGDFKRPPMPLATLSVGRRAVGTRKVDHETRRRLASELLALDLPEEIWEPQTEEPAELPAARMEMIQHPCHGCPDREKHAQWAERASRLVREIERSRKRVTARTETLSHGFARVIEILEGYGYVKGFELTPKGWLLAHIYNESDLVVAETLARGWLEGLNPAELTSIISTFVFESRGPQEAGGELPTVNSRRAWGKILRLTEALKEREQQTRLDLTRHPEAGFAELIFGWSRGASLEDVMDEETSPGDFIRYCKQTLDLIRQIREAAPDSPLDQTLRSAIEALNRGVIAYTGVL